MTRTLRLFEGIGIEREYMIVDAKSLNVRPIADTLLEKVGGDPDCVNNQSDLLAVQLLLALILRDTPGAKLG